MAIAEEDLLDTLLRVESLGRPLNPFGRVQNNHSGRDSVYFGSLTDRMVVIVEGEEELASWKFSYLGSLIASFDFTEEM